MKMFSLVCAALMSTALAAGALAQDAPVASDDIGRFPDQNAAESIQRIPGVALYRDQGEGRFIVVESSASSSGRRRLSMPDGASAAARASHSPTY